MAAGGFWLPAVRAGGAEPGPSPCLAGIHGAHPSNLLQADPASQGTPGVPLLVASLAERQENLPQSCEWHLSNQQSCSTQVLGLSQCPTTCGRKAGVGDY